MHLVAGDGLRLPFADGSFDRVTISFGLRNVADVPACLRELRRVTRPGGRLVVCEFSRPTWAPFRVVYLNYLMRALPPLARAVSSAPDAYVYLAESIRVWPSQSELAARVAAAGWSDVGWRNLSGGIVALHRGTAPHPDPDDERQDAKRNNGEWQRQTREVYDRGNGAAILLYNREKKTVVLTRQFRLPVFVNGHDGLLIEVAAGLLEGAAPQERIRAEAEEETGYRAPRAAGVRGLHEPGLGDGKTALFHRRIRCDVEGQRRRRAGGRDGRA